MSQAHPNSTVTPEHLDGAEVVKSDAGGLWGSSVMEVVEGDDMGAELDVGGAAGVLAATG